MTRKLLVEVAGVVCAPVEQVWTAVLGDAPDHPMRTERGDHTVAYQGGWWYRGEWSVTPHAEGSTLLHRVYCVAGPYWAVALANKGFAGFGRRTRRSFAEGLAGIGERLGCATRLVQR
ncbi:hypothetical protein [Nonomuraea zeae]|uniref:SRPBCC family protein n=1 Tax=Nonomuraea zeae TaxID=1642303 RepID=A0A5S4G0U3_9ACTN|nr:hypothetical protein [Nonomuraea zeae]TMR26559.1 hypothetical protein ETD85_42135 [Nonomuraea zeae]